MANLAYQDLISYAKQKVLDPTLIKKTLAIALGISVARSLNLPSGEVDHAESYYTNQMHMTAVNMITQFNENCLVDFDLARETVRAFWLQRYYNAHPAKTIPIPDDDEGHFMSSFVGVGHLINPQTFEFCQSNARVLIVLINRIRPLTDVMV